MSILSFLMVKLHQMFLVVVRQHSKALQHIPEAEEEYL